MNLEKIIYQTKNWKAHWRALWLGSYIAVEGALARWLGNADRILMMGEVHATIVRANGKRVSLGCLGRRVVTTAGVNYLRDDMNAAAGGADVSLFKFHASGTGVSAEAVGDTALGTEVTDNARTTGSQSGGVSKQYVTVGTITYTAGHAITEHGVFSAVSSGTLWDRTVFSAINVVSGDSIQFTYTLTISDGG